MKDRITTPVLLITFNRPDTAKMVFNQIQKVRPTKLYIAVDGPRVDRLGEAEKCKQCQELVDLVDWDCEVHTLFRSENVGCGFGPARAISWAFETAEELIVLEDDCLPSTSFFYFCEELLHRYKIDKRIGIISGLSIHSGEAILGPYDYTFSRFAHTWGWATWKDRWDDFDMYMKDFPQFLQDGGSFNVYQNKRMSKVIDRRLKRIYDSIEDEVNHSWDTQWSYTRIKNGYLGVVPKLNLITNVGATNGTHSSDGSSSSNLCSNELLFDLVHPTFVTCNANYDNYHFNVYINHSLEEVIKYYFRRPKELYKRILQELRLVGIF